MDEIQQAMLDAMGQPGAIKFPRVIRRIHGANDIDALWYLRGELMAAMSSLHGEDMARILLEDISGQFSHFGLTTRASPLGRH